MVGSYPHQVRQERLGAGKSRVRRRGRLRRLSFDRPDVVLIEAPPIPEEWKMNRGVSALCIALAMVAGVASADPLAGRWVLNSGRTHYGGGAEARKRETFTCEAAGQLVRCTIRSERVSGKRFVGTFSAAYDGRSYATAGIPDVDRVALRRVDDRVADATFSYKGRPVFGYRAIQSDDGRSLTIVSVDPTTRTVLNSVVVYDRR
jgi:hypothetical protein